MPTERDLRLHTYASARLSGLTARDETCAALSAIFARPYPEAYPLPRDEERIAARKNARANRERIRAKGGVDYGFAKKQGALWIVRDALPDFDEMPQWTVESAKMLFDLGRTLYPKLERFARDAEGFAAWHEGRRRLPFDPFFTTVLTGSGIRTDDLRCMGVPMFATSEDGVVWIGLTHDLALFSNRDAPTRLVGIRQQVASFPPAAVPYPWNADALLRPVFADEIRRRHFVRELFRYVFGKRPAIVRNPFRLQLSVVRDVRLGERLGNFAIWVVTELDEKALAERVADVEEALRGSEPDWIVAAVVHRRGFVNELRNALVDCTTASAKYLVFEQEHLESHVATAPWVATQYAPDLGVLLLPPGNRRQLRRRLRPALGTDIRREDVDQLIRRFEKPDAPRRIAIYGRYGNGKSTALLQILQARANTLAVYITPSATEEQLAAVRAILHGVMLQHEIVLGIDDFSANQPIDVLLRALPDRERLVTIVVCESRHDRGADGRLDNEILDVDDADEVFVRRIVERGRNQTFEWFQEDVLPRALRGGYTIRDVLRGLKVATTPERIVNLEDLDTAEELLVRIIGLIAIAVVEPVTARLVGRYYEQLANDGGVARAQVLLRKLERKAWIALDDAEVVIAAETMIMFCGELLHERGRRLFRDEFFRVTEIVAPQEEPRVCDQLLTWVGLEHIVRGDIQEAESLLARHEQRLGSNRLRTAIADHHQYAQAPQVLEGPIDRIRRLRRSGGAS